MDIDDILREAIPEATDFGGANQDLQALTRAWVAERTCPEILPWPGDGLIERVNNRIRAQIERVEEMTGDMDPKTNFSLIVIQTELERWKYLVRSILRARIAKIDRHTLHYLSVPEPHLSRLLSPSEIAYATRHQALLHSHYLASFLSSFPSNLQNLNDTAGGISMIDAPDLDKAVFIRVLQNCSIHARGLDKDSYVDARRGDILVARWSDVKELILDEYAELI